ncbi:uncharacterized protein [Temnothorax longispinosus]|uniref:uncharacterized protein n=1 Tax=Temnothorax longispinosus TaxID=300112 RepID=UPI003A98DA12
MEAYEMDDLNPSIRMQSMFSHSIDMESNDIIAFTSICRHCNEDDSKGKLIRPCECTGDREFMHIHCLEYTSNLRKQSHCTHCNVAFPLEVKYKSLIQICRNSREMCDMFRAVCYSLFIVLGTLTYNACMIFIIVRHFMLALTNNSWIKGILNFGSIIVIGVLIGLHIPYELELLQRAYATFRRARARWLAVNTERKVIKSFIHEV